MNPMLSIPFRHGTLVLATALVMGAMLPALAYDVTSPAAINVDANGVISAFMDHHAIIPVIDRTFAFDQAAEAYRHREGAGHMGRILITV